MKEKYKIAIGEINTYCKDIKGIYVHQQEKNNKIVIYSFGGYDIVIKMSSNSTIELKVATKFSSSQMLQNVIVLGKVPSYTTNIFLDNPIEFFLYLRGIGDNLIKLHYDKIALDKFNFVVMGQKLQDIVDTVDSID